MCVSAKQRHTHIYNHTRVLFTVVLENNNAFYIGEKHNLLK